MRRLSLTNIKDWVLTSSVCVCEGGKGGRVRELRERKANESVMREWCESAMRVLCKSNLREKSYATRATGERKRERERKREKEREKERESYDRELLEREQ